MPAPGWQAGAGVEMQSVDVNHDTTLAARLKAEIVDALACLPVPLAAILAAVIRTMWPRFRDV